MDAELPIWRRCFLGKVFEQWRNQVLNIGVRWFDEHWFSLSRQIEECEGPNTEECEECEECEGPNTDDEECEGPNRDDGV